MPSFLESILLGVQRRSAHRSLRELDDRLLRDIGLTRHEIHTIGPKGPASHLLFR